MRALGVLSGFLLGAWCAFVVAFHYVGKQFDEWRASLDGWGEALAGWREAIDLNSELIEALDSALLSGGVVDPDTAPRFGES